MGRRIGAVAALTLRETTRQATLAAVIGLAGLAGLVAWSLGNWGFGDPAAAGFAVSFGLGAQAALGLALALIVAADVMHGDAQERRADLLLARGLTRLEWLLGRWLGVTALVALFGGGLLGVTTIARLMNHPSALGWPAIASMAAASGILLLRAAWAVAVVAALAVLLRGRLLLVVGGASVIMAAQGRGLLEDSLQRALGAGVGGAGVELVRALPDLATWDLTPALERGGVEPAGLLRLAPVVGGHLILALGIAAMAWAGRGERRPAERRGARLGRLARFAAVGVAFVGAGGLLDRVGPERSEGETVRRREPAQADVVLSLLGGYRETAANLAWIRAQAASERADPAATRRSLETAVRLAPDRLHFRIHGARILAYDLAAAVPSRRDDLRREARQWLERAEADHPDRAEIPIEAALLALREREPGDDAIRAFGRAARLPGAPDYAGRIEADLLGRAGRWEEARRAWLREFARLGARQASPSGEPDLLGWTLEDRRDAVARRIGELEELMETPREKRFRWPPGADEPSLGLSGD